MGFEVVNVAFVYDILPVQFSAVSFIPLVLYSHSFIDTPMVLCGFSDQ